MSGETWRIGPLRVEPGQTLRGVFPIDVGLTHIDFPLALINGIEPDPVLLVTAGMDGDEYTAVEAALRLIDVLNPKQLRGRVIICPVLDPLSFEALHRQNPLDGLFVRDQFPGDLNGKPTQRLAHFLYHNFVLNADLWVALEAPDTAEVTIPYVFTYQGDDAHVNEGNRLALNQSGAVLGLLHPPVEWPPALHSMVANTNLLVSTAGNRHQIDEEAVQAHLKVVYATLHGMDILPQAETPALPQVFPAVQTLRAEQTGLWVPRAKAGDAVQPGQVVGELFRLDRGEILQTVTSPVEGLLLSVRNGLATRPRLRVGLVAHHPQPAPPETV
ncbi:MAG: succinylglutamate desuccinylase/aspartoacylase family protein [Anaerolineae bacterium]